MITKEYKEFIDKSPEQVIYFMIEESAAYIHHMGLKFINREIKPADVIKVQKDMEEVSERHNYLITTVKRFGVTELYEKKGDKQFSSIEYRRWYSHWDNWKKGLSNKDWAFVREKLSKGESFDELLPTTNWND
jgi:hypothetical protein